MKTPDQQGDRREVASKEGGADVVDVEKVDDRSPEQLRGAAAEASTGILAKAQARGEQAAHAFARGVEFLTRRQSRETPSRLMGDAAQPVGADVDSYRSARDSKTTPPETRLAYHMAETLFTGLSLPPEVLNKALEAAVKFFSSTETAKEDASSAIEKS